MLQNIMVKSACDKASVENVCADATHGGTQNFPVWFATYAVYLGPIVFLQNANLAGLSAINITLSAASSSVTSIVLCALLDDAMDITVVLNGILAGLVAVSASFCLVLPWHALITGFVGGIFYNCGRKLLWYLHVDDPCDAISVHLFVVAYRSPLPKYLSVACWRHPVKCTCTRFLVSS